MAARNVAAIMDSTRKDNTDIACKKKIFEHIEFSDHRRGHLEEAVRCLVSGDNIQPFFFHCCFREKRPGGKKNQKKRKDGDQQHLCFMPSECEKIVKAHEEHGRTRTAPPDPSNGVGFSDVEQVKNALKKLCQEQVSDRVNNLAWDLVWTLPLQDMFVMVKKRKARVDKANFAKKMDTMAMPCLIVKWLGDIENCMWMDGVGQPANTVCSTLRDRSSCNRTRQTIC